MFRLRYFLLLAPFLLTACVTDETLEPLEPTDGPQTFGIRADRDLADYEDLAVGRSGLPDFGPVVALSYSLDGSAERDFVATGTLVAPEWVLTAGHNFFDAATDPSPAPASGILVLMGNDPNAPVRTVAVRQVILHPAWAANRQDLADGADLCLLRLAEPIDIPPANLYTADDEALGTTAYFCGFGDYSETAGQDPDAFSRKHAVANVLDRAVGGLSATAGGRSYPGGLLAFDFDAPGGGVNTLGDGTVNADEALLGGGTSAAEPLDLEGTTVEGDSGGPLFVRRNGAWLLAGVLSGGAEEPFAGHRDGSYGDISLFMRVGSSRDWIEGVIR